MLVYLPRVTREDLGHDSIEDREPWYNLGLNMADAEIVPPEEEPGMWGIEVLIKELHKPAWLDAPRLQSELGCYIWLKDGTALSVPEDM